MSFVFVLLIVLTLFSATHESPTSVNPGPRQVCTCFPPDTPDVCPTVGVPGSKPGSKPPLPAGDELQCKKQISMRISIVADNTANLFICGQVVRSTVSFGVSINVSYSGGCEDLVFLLTNDDGPVGVAVLVDANGKKYGTMDKNRRFRTPGTRALFGRIKYAPSGAFTNNPPEYDFSSWTPAVVVEGLRFQVGFRFMAS